MTPQRKLRLANFLMVLGVVPLLLGIAWIVSAIVYIRQHPGQGAGSDAFLMIFLLVVTYAFALVVSGASALWSALVARRAAGLRDRTAAITRTVVGMILAGPLLWYLGITLSAYARQ